MVSYLLLAVELGEIEDLARRLVKLRHAPTKLPLAGGGRVAAIEALAKRP